MSNAYAGEGTQPLLNLAPLRTEGQIAVVSPASTPRAELVARGLTLLRERGFTPVLGKHVLARGPQYLAGTAEERLADLHAAFADEAIAAIVCSRGGYGCNYLLPGLDLELIRKHPKPLLGYSDVTVLQTWLLDTVGLPSFHGPMLTADFATEDGVHEPSLVAALAGRDYAVGTAEGLRVLRHGKAEGVLYGGCMSLLCSMLGTPYEPRLEGKLLFLEDVGESAYRLDRLLRQLALSGKLNGVKGFVFGEMKGCASTEAEWRTLDEVLLRVLADFPGPIAIGLRSGHVSRQNVTLALGRMAELNTEGEPVLMISAR